MRMTTSRTLATALLFAVSLSAQPRFDIVSIRPVPPNTPPTLRSSDFNPVLPGGQYIDSRANLFFLIAFAYDVKNPSKQLVGLPAWAMDASYAIGAKPAQDFPVLSEAENREQVRLMLRHMLEDRFRLRLHTETRQGRIYGLKVGKGGFKIPEVSAPAPPEKEGRVGAAVGNTSGRMIGNKVTLAGMAQALEIFLKDPVVDQTGLAGFYDFDVRWTAPETGQPSGGLGADGITSLISNLQDQFGLQLTTTKGPVKYWVVDHVEPPTEN
jgi:uncharacterized protein (TIGR03435 family)